MATKTEWAEWVKQWATSGLDAAAFAKREHINAKRLVWWRWKLRSSAALHRPPDSVQFLPVRVVETATAMTNSAVPLEIALPNGLLVRIPPGFDPATLARVLSIASEVER
jgi:transposase